MTRLEFGSFTFEPPQPWIHQAMVFVGPALRNGNTPNILVTRGVRQPGEALEALVWRTMFETSKTAQDFALMESQKRQVAGRPAMQIRFRSVTEAGMLDQTLIFVEGQNHEIVKVACSFLYMADQAPIADEEWAPTLEHLLQTMLVKTAVSDVAPKMDSGSWGTPVIESVDVDAPIVPMPGDRRRSAR